MTEILSSIILMGMGAYGIILYSTNKLGLYIHPRFFEESFIASIVALIIGSICFTYYVLKKQNLSTYIKKIFTPHVFLIVVLIALSFFINSLFLVIAAFVIVAPNKNMDSLLKENIFSNAIAIIIVAIAIGLPSKGLSSITASQRSIDLNSINLTQTTISAVQNFNKSTANYSLGDWIAMLGFNPDPLFYKDKDVKISGFIYKPDSLHLEENSVLVSRFIVTCCAVDARPVGLKVKLPENSGFKIDDWVEVTGKFSLDSKNELVIITDSINRIDTPNNPYIF